MYNTDQNTLHFCQHMVFLFSHLPSPYLFHIEHNAELIHPNWRTILTLFRGGEGLHLMSIQNHAPQLVFCQVSIGILARSLCSNDACNISDVHASKCCIMTSFFSNLHVAMLAF